MFNKHLIEIMKKKYLLLIMFGALSLFLNAQQEKPFYYYKGEKFYLQVDYARISVISEGRFDVDNAKTLTTQTFSVANEGKSYTMQNVIPIDEDLKMVQYKEIFITEMEFSEMLKQTNYYDIIQQLSKGDNIVKVLPAHTVLGQKLGISNNFYVKLFKEEDRNSLFELADKHSIQVLGYNEFMPLWFTLSCTQQTPLGTMDAANLFFETDLFECAEPEFLYHNLFLSNDTYFSDQWGLKNTGQYDGTIGVDIKAEQAWTIATGSNVRVAIFDHGFEMDHPDLVNNTYGTGYDATTNSKWF